jgi:hypothetical protein
MTHEKRKRAVNIPGSNVGMQRYNLYKEAYAWIDIAIEKGFYLEAITIIESLITDRLESFLSYRVAEDVSFKTLGPLITSVIKNIEDEELRDLATTELNEWRDKRNDSLHEMVKLEEGDTSTWDDRKKELLVIAMEGKEILEKVRIRLTYLQKKEKTEAKEQKKTLNTDERYKKFRERMDSSYRHGINIDKENSQESTPPPEPVDSGNG